eukprot:TRINITY_DN17874_c0_g1_i2.p2 TRINITY_DN17874_c0_g1~~TRINITY_DN17874_c0_g1_i2.p2  ORF type:complete len:324 (-),score=15.59 TRINITY_DN17874_c0_g1_i2:446-1417(-)
MKYSKFITGVEHLYFKDFQVVFLKYKALKKLLKDQSTLEEFFTLLENNIQDIKRDFGTLSKKVLRDYNIRNSFFHKCMGISAASFKQKICYNAYQCLRYAHVNTVGLRKIVKKHDKEYKSDQGKQFLQKVWADNRKENFVHSPLLWELAAIYKTGEVGGMRMTVESGDNFWKEVPDIVEDLDISDRLHTISMDYIDESQWNCPICLGLLYQPVGLGCGHKFCIDCAVAAVNNGELESRPLQFLRSLNQFQQCPECRQHGVFKQMIQLKILDRVIHTKFPKEYSARQKENRQEKSEQLKKRMQDRIRNWGGDHTFHPHALVLSM